MNGSAKRMMAMIAVLAMIASAMVVVFTDEQDSSADVDYNKYYYDQLEDDSIAKNVYDKVVDVDNFGAALTITIDISASEKAKMDADDDYIGNQINKGIVAAGYDDPKEYYYIQSSSLIVGSITSSDGWSTATFTLNKISSLTGTKSSYDAAINTEIDRIYDDEIDKSDNVTKVTSIHNYVAHTLVYDKLADASEIRSVYFALCDDDHKAVCEGYAKMFKVLCMKCNIPCLIITGDAATKGEKESHMWNYVLLDDQWYLVDSTWGDQEAGPVGAIVDDYLLVGTNSVGFDDKKVVESHVPTMNGRFTAPLLSFYSYTDRSNPQYLVTFKLNVADETPYSAAYYGSGTYVILPSDPEDSLGHYFLNWYNGEVEFDPSTPVTGDMTIVAKWNDVLLLKLIYDTVGGTEIQPSKAEIADPTHPEVIISKPLTVTDRVPTKEGYKFIEWNTAKDGTGISFKADDEIILSTEEYTLYAIWEDTNSVTYKIDSTVDRINKFLGQETISGVSNMVLTIGVITGIVSLLAIAAIARK